MFSSVVKTAFWLIVAVMLGTVTVDVVLNRHAQRLQRLIAREARARKFDPDRVAEMVGRLSGSDPAFAVNGRYGLMALTTNDAAAWAAKTGNKFETFDLFDPQTNLRIGLWKLAQEESR